MSFFANFDHWLMNLMKLFAQDLELQKRRAEILANVNKKVNGSLIFSFSYSIHYIIIVINQYFLISTEIK